VGELVRATGLCVQALEIFDSWAGELSPDDFMTFSFPYLKRIVTEVKKEVRFTPLVL